MRYFIVFFFVLMSMTPTLAQEPSAGSPSTPQVLNEQEGAADRFHRKTTENLIALSENLDSFFPNPDNHRFDYRRSRLQVQLGSLVDSKGDIRILQRLVGRIVMPRLEDRLSIYFSGEGEDLNRTEEDAANNPFFVPTIEDTQVRLGFNMALRFVFTNSDIYLVQNQLGVRLLPSLDPYNELSAQLRIPLSENFLWQPGQSLFWRESTGFGETTRYDLDYALGPGAIVRLHQEGTVTQESAGYEHLHSLALHHQVNQKSGYVFALEARGETSPEQRMTQYLAIFTWKELIYKDWLYVETGSRLLFEYEDSFEPVPAIFFTLIADFNGKKSASLPSRPREKTSPAPL